MGSEREPDADQAEETVQEGQVDGAAEAAPGTVPEGATPKVEPVAGDPLADAHDDVGESG